MWMWGRRLAWLKSPACHAGDRGFECHRPRHLFYYLADFSKEKPMCILDFLSKYGIKSRGLK